ncbi:hypothetical protein ACN4EK_29965, partial [Pantanalinema rosaneae CENA516]|uniref:hypothetical protein n=1 Tax=Pantanalinema rosaneae TaxID=1620701 RepID=UPI003D6E44D7
MCIRDSSSPTPIASALLATSLSILIAVIAWRVVSTVNQTRSSEPIPEPSAELAPAPVTQSTPSSPSVPPSPVPSPPQPVPNLPNRVTGLDEQAILAAVRDRRRELGIAYPFFTSLVDELFYKKYPDLQGQKLGNTIEQQSLRQEWATIAMTLLDRLATLPPNTLAQLGRCQVENHPTGDNRFPASDRFDQLFPELQGQSLNPTTFGQIGCAIATTKP